MTEICCENCNEGKLSCECFQCDYCSIFLDDLEIDVMDHIYQKFDFQLQYCSLCLDNHIESYFLDTKYIEKEENFEETKCYENIRFYLKNGNWDYDSDYDIDEKLELEEAMNIFESTIES